MAASVPARVEVDRAVRAAGEYLPDEPREHRPRPDFDERPRTARIHRLDLLDEAHRPGELHREQPAHRGRIFGIGRGFGVGEDGDRGRLEGDRRQKPFKVAGCIRHQRRMKGRRDRQTQRRQPVDPQLRLEPLDGVRRTGDHDLVRRVVIREHHLGMQREQRPHLLGAGPHRRHRPRRLCGSRHQFPAPQRHAEERRRVENPRRVQSGDLAERVPADAQSDATPAAASRFSWASAVAARAG